MGRLRFIGIFMAGEVLVPWSYSVSALSTVMQALFVAGGVTSYGSSTSLRLLLLHFKEVGYFG
ncbi:MAG: polysaccharide export outer membrane protein [Candidatus Azotimanducaceae bacterium]|jgi:polysaccharide export outer membrane protein